MSNRTITRRSVLAGLPAACCARLLRAGVAGDRSTSAIDQLIDRIVANEARVLKLLGERTPIIETYIQESRGDVSSFTASRDDYFLGRMGLVNAMNYVSFVRRQSTPPPILETRTASRFFFLKKTVATETVPEHIEFLPEGFAQMTVIDSSAFDRRTYKFDYVRREFLGDVRCLVFDLTPIREGEPGKFVGRFWVEDETWCVTRINGTYNRKSDAELYFHFDSWRVNHAPGIWAPAVVYIEDSVPLGASGAGAPHGFKAQTRVWSYESPTNNRLEELTSILVDAGRNVTDANESKEISPLESQRRWEREAEANVVERLERIGLLSREGDVDKVLNTVVNNLIVTGNLDVEAKCRLLLTTPLETFTIGHTIVISRGLVDVLPDEASLALVLAAELAHIALAHPTRTEYAFNDRTMIGDEAVLERFRFPRTPEEISTAAKKAIALLADSPYKDKLANAGLFLRALDSRTKRLPKLIQANLGNGLGRYLDMPEFAGLLAKAPQLDESKLEQIAALPLGSRVRVEPWANDASLMKARPLSLLSAREKMPFEVSPVTLYLTRAGASAGQPAAQAAEDRSDAAPAPGSTPPQGSASESPAAAGVIRR